MTRAHLVVVVVNEFVAGGWLEFLGSVRLREEERFDAATELARSRTGRERVVRRRFNVSLPRARVPEKASTLRERSER